MLEPRSRRFWRELAPGDGVVDDWARIKSAVNACPLGGCILLRPGTYTSVDAELDLMSLMSAVSLFGRGQATMVSSSATVLVTASNPTPFAAWDGITMRLEVDGGIQSMLAISGPLRLQSCVVQGGGISVLGDKDEDHSPLIINCEIHGCSSEGISLFFGARPRIVESEIWGNVGEGILVRHGDPTISKSTIRDNGRAGIKVLASSHGLATILPDNVFLRNGGGDVVREAPE